MGSGMNIPKQAFKQAVSTAIERCVGTAKVSGIGRRDLLASYNRFAQSAFQRLPAGSLFRREGTYFVNIAKAQAGQFRLPSSVGGVPQMEASRFLTEILIDRFCPPPPPPPRPPSPPGAPSWVPSPKGDGPLRVPLADYWPKKSPSLSADEIFVLGVIFLGVVLIVIDGPFPIGDIAGAPLIVYAARQPF